MELSVVRIHKADSPSGPPWTHTRLVVPPEKYLSQCPFVLLSEDWYPPDGGFSSHRHEGTVMVVLVLHGSVKHSYGAGAQRQLSRGDAAFLTTGAGVLHGEVAGEHGAHLMRLWLSTPEQLHSVEPRYEVVRCTEAGQAALGQGTARVYAGKLADSSAPLRSPWPITLADLRLPPDAQLTLPLHSSERCFAYVMDGEVEIGRNRVCLARGNVAWIERGLEPGGIGNLPMHAIKRTRVLLFASPVAEMEPTAPGARTRAYRALRAAQMAAREPQGSIA